MIALSNAAGTIVEGYAYDVCGTCTVNTSSGTDSDWLTPDGTTATSSAYGNPYLFTGRRLDNETALYHYRVRAYNPTLGRFLQPDPIGYSDGPNLYAYCENAPQVWVDPFGLSKEGQGGWDWSRGLDSLAGFAVGLGQSAYGAVEYAVRMNLNPVGTSLNVVRAIPGIPAVVRQFGDDIASSDAYTNGNAVGRLTGNVAIIIATAKAGSSGSGVKPPPRIGQAARSTIGGSLRRSFSRAASQLDRNGLTKAGRALQKHSSRRGSVYRTSATKARGLNSAGQSIADDIINNSRSTITRRANGSMDVISPDGRGIRYNPDGTFRGFLEPK